MFPTALRWESLFPGKNIQQEVVLEAWIPPKGQSIACCMPDDLKAMRWPAPVPESEMSCGQNNIFLKNLHMPAALPGVCSETNLGFEGSANSALLCEMGAGCFMEMWGPLSIACCPASACHAGNLFKVDPSPRIYSFAGCSCSDSQAYTATTYVDSQGKTS